MSVVAVVVFLVGGFYWSRSARQTKQKKKSFLEILEDETSVQLKRKWTGLFEENGRAGDIKFKVQYTDGKDLSLYLLYKTLTRIGPVLTVFDKSFLKVKVKSSYGGVFTVYSENIILNTLSDSDKSGLPEDLFLEPIMKEPARAKIINQLFGMGFTCISGGKGYPMAAIDPFSDPGSFRPQSAGKAALLLKELAGYTHMMKIDD